MPRPAGRRPSPFALAPSSGRHAHGHQAHLSSTAWGTSRRAPCGLRPRARSAPPTKIISPSTRTLVNRRGPSHEASLSHECTPSSTGPSTAVDGTDRSTYRCAPATSPPDARQSRQLDDLVIVDLGCRARSQSTAPRNTSDLLGGLDATRQGRDRGAPDPCLGPPESESPQMSFSAGRSSPSAPAPDGAAPSGRPSCGGPPGGHRAAVRRNHRRLRPRADRPE